MQESVSAATEHGTRGPTAARAAQPLVLGLGNALLCDEGAGVQLTALLKTAQLKRAQRTMQCNGAGDCPTADFIDGGLMSLSLFRHVEKAAALLVIQSSDLHREPGTVTLFEGAAMDAFVQIPRRRSIHERGLVDLLEVARERGCLPLRRAVLCIQPKRVDWGEALSLPVFRALPEASSVVAALLERWRHG